MASPATAMPGPRVAPPRVSEKGGGRWPVPLPTLPPGRYPAWHGTGNVGAAYKGRCRTDAPPPRRRRHRQCRSLCRAGPFPAGLLHIKGNSRGLSYRRPTMRSSPPSAAASLKRRSRGSGEQTAACRTGRKSVPDRAPSTPWRGDFDFGNRWETVSFANAKEAGPVRPGLLANMVLPARFERTAYRLGGESEGFHQVSLEHIKSLAFSYGNP